MLLAVAGCEMKLEGKPKSSLTFLPKPRRKRNKQVKTDYQLNWKKIDTFQYLIFRTLVTYFS